MGLSPLSTAAPATHETISPNWITTRLDFLVNWGRANSLWPMPFGTACCAIEFMATAASRFDLARFGMERMSFSPRQADVLICAGRVPFKLAPIIRRIWQQMPQPKWAISMGACASTGGMFDNYAVVQGIDTIIPVDVYVPGCPPRPGRPALRHHAAAEEDHGRDDGRSVAAGRAARRSRRPVPSPRRHRRDLRAVRQLGPPDEVGVSELSRPRQRPRGGALTPRPRFARSARGFPTRASVARGHVGADRRLRDRDPGPRRPRVAAGGPGAAVRLPHRHHLRRVPRSRAAARGGLPAALARAARPTCGSRSRSIPTARSRCSR